MEEDLKAGTTGPKFAEIREQKLNKEKSRYRGRLSRTRFCNNNTRRTEQK